MADLSRHPCARRRPTPVLPLPSIVEAAALAEAARYLRRAGTQVATVLLLAPRGGVDAAMLETLRDELLSSAAFCEGILAEGTIANPAPISRGVPVSARPGPGSGST